jgi:AraC family transcriptional regulator
MSTALRIFQGEFGRVALLDMDKSLVPHAHSQCHVLIKASGADTHFGVRDRHHLLSERSAVLVNAWEPHFYAHRTDAPRTIILALYIEPAWLSAIQSSLRLSAARPDFFRQPCVEISPRIRALADDMIMEMLSPDEVPKERVEALLFELMLSVIDPFSEWRRLTDLIVSNRHHGHDPRIRRSISFIKANLGMPMSMDMLAREAHLSRAHFFSLFRRCTQMSPNVFINMMRMDRACQRLADQRSGTLGHLSAELGFSEQSHFTRFFRQHLGVAPSEYRRVVDVYSEPPQILLARSGSDI